MERQTRTMTMKKTYTITIETKADGTMPDEECIREAVLAYHRASIAEITVADTITSRNDGRRMPWEG